MSRGTTLALCMGALLAGGCDYTGDFLFAGAIEGMPGIYHIYAEDGSDFLATPVIESEDDLRAATIYAEIGATGSSDKGGATFYFLGTGGDVCVWVDPETAYYNQMISETAPSNLRQFAYPNNLFDDGDLDLFVGKSVYYTGSPGETIGDFFVSYTDSLGNEVPIELSECNLIGYSSAENAHTGRGQPEFCTIRNTEVGISYTGLMHTFATPVDDDRLGYALLVADGSCANLRADFSIGNDACDETLLMGDSIFPSDKKDYGPFYGYDPDRSWPGSESFEQTFCSAFKGELDMYEYCEDELKDHYEAGASCQWEELTDPNNRCYCGDIRDTPEGGQG